MYMYLYINKLVNYDRERNIVKQKERVIVKQKASMTQGLEQGTILDKGSY